MPHHPSEEEAPTNLTDKVAQHSKDSTASDHPLHNENKGPIEAVSGGSHGPQIPTGKKSSFPLFYPLYLFFRAQTVDSSERVDG